MIAGELEYALNNDSWSNYTSQDLSNAVAERDRLLNELNNAISKVADQRSQLDACNNLHIGTFETRDGQCRKQLGLTQGSFERLYNEALAEKHRIQTLYDAQNEKVSVIERSLATNNELAIGTANVQEEIAEAKTELSKSRRVKAFNYLIYIVISAIILVGVVLVLKKTKK